MWKIKWGNKRTSAAGIFGELGEAFVFGVDDPTAYMKRLGFDSAYHVASSEFFKTTDPVAGMYKGKVCPFWKTSVKSGCVIRSVTIVFSKCSKIYSDTNPACQLVPQPGPDGSGAGGTAY